MSAATVSVSLVASTPQQWTWDILVPINPARFYPKFGPLPAVVGVEDQTGPWHVVGSSRQLQLSDGGTVTETITHAVEPAFHAYRLTEFTKLFGRLVDYAHAEWTFEPEPRGTVVTWTYTFVAKKRWGWLVKLIVRLAWDPYMRQVLPEIVHEAERLAP
jgi:hypothetical protein